jgi:DNA polymerase-1
MASSPNIQNFPRPGDDPRPYKLRSAVIPRDPSHCLLGVDFSSIETITNAYESHDMDRVQAALSGSISHQGTAHLVNQQFGLSLGRQHGKIINHAFDKGESPFNLASRLFGQTRPSRQQIEQCRQIYRGMLACYPQTARFRDELWERSAQNPLTVRNAFGREFKCFSRSQYGDSERQYRSAHDPTKKYWCSCAACAPRRDRWKGAMAFLGRSCAFDILLRVMVRIVHEQRLDDYSLPYLEVHDELDFSVPREKVHSYAQQAKEAFEQPIPELDGIVIPAEVQWGNNWAEAH